MSSTASAAQPWPPLDRLRPLLAAATRPVGLANALTPQGGSERRADLAYGPAARHRLDLYLPRPQARRAGRMPLLVFLYGGGWQEGQRQDYGFIARVLAARGIAVAVPDYRLWPEVRWPGFIEDAAAAIAWLRGPAGRAAGVPEGPVHLMGHSAGGTIAAALALDPGWLAAAGLPGGRGALAGCVALAAPFEWTPTKEPLAAIFAAARGGAIRAAPDAATGLRGAPPMLLVHGLGDRVVSPLQSAHMAARLRGAGQPVRLRAYPRIGHVGVLAAMAAPVRRLGLAGAPVLQDVLGLVAPDGTADAARPAWRLTAPPRRSPADAPRQASPG